MYTTVFYHVNVIIGPHPSKRAGAMQVSNPKLKAIALLIGATALLVLEYPSEVRAQTAGSLLCPGNTQLINGQCYDGAFSGAAQASQALSDLSETTTQESSRTTLKKITDRREEEENRCAAGFRRVDGECQPISPPAREVEATVPPPPSPKVKKPKKPKVAAAQPEEEQVPAKKAARREKPQPKPPQVMVAPLPSMVCKDGPCAPIPIEPGARFGAWTEAFGDYEHRDASAPAFVTVGSGGGAPLPAGSPVPVLSSAQSRSGTVGVQMGGDITTRGIWAANDGLIAGAMAGFARTDLTLKTSALSSNFALVNNLSGLMDASLTGGMVGLYATYFNGGFSTDLLVKADVFSLSEKFTDLLAFSAGSPPNACGGSSGVTGAPFDCLFSGYDPIPVINVTLMGDLNYRFNLYQNFWIEPTVGALFTSTNYPDISKPNGPGVGTGFTSVPGGTTTAAARLGLANGDLVMVQGGARFGTDFFLGNSVHTTAIISGLVYDDVLVAGGFIPSLAFQGTNLLAQADQGQVRGRGVLAFNFDLGQGVTSFIQGEIRGGQGLFGAGGKAGVRVVW
jgi:outer membrane biosynthesis protein TonB